MFIIEDFILLAQPTRMGTCELFLVKNCIRLVFLKFSNKFALIQLLISVTAPLMSFVKFEGFGLVKIILYHLQIKLTWIYCCYL